MREVETASDRPAPGLCLGENIHAVENKMDSVLITVWRFALPFYSVIANGEKLYVPVFFLKEIIFLLICALLPVAYKRRIETKECSFAHDLLQTYSLAKQFVMTCKSLRCSQFLSVAVKHLTRLDGINRL